MLANSVSYCAFRLARIQGPHHLGSLQRPHGYLPLVACALAILLGGLVEAALIAALVGTNLVTTSILDARTGRALAAAGLTATTPTPRTRRISRMCELAALGILGLVAAIFVLGMLQGQSEATAHPAVIALVVAVFPMELPYMISASLAAGAVRMARRDVRVRRLPAVEQVGGTTVVLVNKAGLLTQDQLTVTLVVADGRTYEVTGAGHARDGEIRAAGVPVSLGENAALDECLLAGLACNNSRAVEEGGRWCLIGDPTERALITSAAKAGLEKAPPRVDTLPFAPDRRYMATLHRLGTDEPGVVYLKGSVERVLYLCDGRLDADGRRQEFDRDATSATARSLGRRGLRVLAFAYADVPAEFGTLTEDTLPRLVFLGFQAMHDPPRLRAVDAVRACQDMGIEVKMITGDEDVTARAHASWVGLNDDAIMTGADLTACRPDELPEAAARTDVFARVSPEERCLLVRALQSRHHVVAVTDGDRDSRACALRPADVSVRLGYSESEDDALDAGDCDLIISDGDLASIAAAVEEGRGVRDNLVKIIVFSLSAHLSLGLVLVTAVSSGAADAALLVFPVQVLWLGVVAMMPGLPSSPSPITRRSGDASRPLGSP
jgi:cation-transporting ATPase F